MSSYSIDEIHNSNHNYDNASHDDAASSVVGDAHMADYVALGWSISSYTQEADDGQFLLLVGIAFLLGLGKGKPQPQPKTWKHRSPLSISIFLLSLFDNKTLGLSLTFRFGFVLPFRSIVVFFFVLET